ncbi:MAG: response regulator [Planctomycetes bacterium]|nr:response regulator [Planctomycetota bacterium]
MASILVVDDDMVVRELVAAHLRARGFAVVDAPDGRAAQQMLESRRIDLVVLDLEMPLMDGHQLLRWLRAEQPLVRAVVLTGSSSVQEALACLRAGAFAFVTKPLVDMAALDRAVDLAVQVIATWHDQLGFVRRRRLGALL